MSADATPTPESAPRGRARRGLGGLLLGGILVVGLPLAVVEFGRFGLLGEAPFALVFAVWSVVLLWRGLRRRTSDGRGALAFNLGVVFLVLACVELGMAFAKRGARPELIHTPPVTEYVQQHPDLGHAPLPRRTYRVAEVLGAETIYDATYTIDQDGLRTGPALSDDTEGSALFFGGSFLYGWGLGDEETIPHRVETALEGRLRAYNFSYSGYGAHQMLAALESGRVRQLVRFEPRIAVYLAIPDHARRVLGTQLWARRGPRYHLEEDGGVRRDGDFTDDAALQRSKAIRRFVDRSHIGGRVRRWFRRTAASPELLAAIVDAARSRIRDANPDCAFHVILWDSRSSLTAEVAGALRERGLEVHAVSDILPGFADDPARYQLHAEDIHPTAEAHELIAEYVVTELLE